MRVWKGRLPDGGWVLRPMLDREPSRIWYREHILMQWIPVEELGEHPHNGRAILRELDRQLTGIWLAPEGSEIIRFSF